MFNLLVFCINGWKGSQDLFLNGIEKVKLTEILMVKSISWQSLCREHVSFPLFKGLKLCPINVFGYSAQKPWLTNQESIEFGSYSLKLAGALR